MKKPFNMRKTVRYALSFAAYTLITFADGKFTPFSLGLLLAGGAFIMVAFRRGKL